jgi:hypothetical protein
MGGVSLTFGSIGVRRSLTALSGGESDPQHDLHKQTIILRAPRHRPLPRNSGSSFSIALLVEAF